ncbi:hypothetical protein BJ138DRAFT_1130635 [Hygrophoropsis aurantiaca]|uniref:Uncharacterized protein n=1 Tax=Hygrophoropsis aurantiaca TaxID=72124 RepID=A0ACB7ZVR3_9AGAM|nr:hypothetical protein BJ138DRAFT_1130635 [Hygrophoropsis aurantiaca]
MDISSRRKQFTSILPYEIVEEIFLLCRTPFNWGNCHDSPIPHPPLQNVPILLSHVSKTWREIVRTTPALWTNVCIHNPSKMHPAILGPILHRSKGRSLMPCIAVDKMNVEDSKFLDICMKELSYHSDRIRSLRLLVKFWSLNIPIPPLPRLEELKIETSQSGRYPEYLYPLFDSPRLRKVTWLGRRFPEPLLQMGHQIKELSVTLYIFFDCMRLAKILHECPNLAYLDLCLADEAYPPGPLPPVCLQDLRDFRSIGLSTCLCIAPNLHSFTFHTGEYTNTANLPEFLCFSPRLEYLSLDLLSEEMSLQEIFSQIVPLTPSLVTLEFTVRVALPLENINITLKMLGRTGEWGSILPNLQHFAMNVTSFRLQTEVAFVYDAEILLHMLESRCNSGEQPSLGGEAPVAALGSCTMNDDIDPSIDRWDGSKRHLDMVQEHGLVLKGSIFTSTVNPDN